mmetsp:Transcript_13887/g.34725  ORF Transcript_13887/g.34725 Transcript_13887/m.34725 type:complete len:216 (+) Transcript_13887:1249-1896(+)
MTFLRWQMLSTSLHRFQPHFPSADWVERRRLRLPLRAFARLAREHSARLSRTRRARCTRWFQWEVRYSSTVKSRNPSRSYGLRLSWRCACHTSVATVSLRRTRVPSMQRRTPFAYAAADTTTACSPSGAVGTRRTRVRTTAQTSSPKISCLRCSLSRMVARTSSTIDSARTTRRLRFSSRRVSRSLVVRVRASSSIVTCTGATCSLRRRRMSWDR